VHDLVLRNGTLVDGTGAPARKADVAVKEGRIVAIGDDVGPGAKTLDVTGLLVTPGFVDIHTHYDGQVSWDADLMPSSIHGVTTAVMGSCGVGFAPCREEDRDRLVALMEGVEDIPGTALSEGIQWAWSTFAEYMDALDRTPHAIDYGVQVPHDALRVFAMGERAMRGEAATDQDIAAMQAELDSALRAGAVGFSTGRTDNHRSRSGSPTPAAEADLKELLALAAVFRRFDHGMLQAVSDFDIMQGPARFDVEFDVLERMAEAAPGHSMSLSLSQREPDDGQWKRILERVERATARGVPMKVQVAPRGIGVLLGFEATFHPFMGFPTYKRLAHLPLAERVAALREPATRAQLLSEKSDRVAGDGSSVPPLADFLLSQIDRIAFRMFRLGDPPDYEPSPSASLGAEARARGVPTLEVILDALLGNDGREFLYFPIFNYLQNDLEAVREMLTHPLALPGLSDGGAHVGTICDASFPTFLLQHWVRDRKTGRIPLERAVQMLTQDTATHAGLVDRGTVAVGKRADLTVIDLAGISLSRPRLVADLPAGGRRLLQDATGYRATFVAGELIAEHGKLTGARPGRLVRANRLGAP
jgi:N-acyl-D-aspartate/D-glutamate deacylase